MRFDRTLQRATGLVGLVALLFLGIGPNAAAQTTSAPWFDPVGFYNKPNATPARVANDVTACRIEAARVSRLRGNEATLGVLTGGPVGLVVSGIMTLAMNAENDRYNGSIAHKEFRACAASFGYRRYQLSERERLAFNATPDRGFAALVSAQSPTDGRLDTDVAYDNYYSKDLVERAYLNQTPPPDGVAPSATGALDQDQPPPDSVAPSATVAVPPTMASPAEPSVRIYTPAPTARISVARMQPGQVSSTQGGMAIVVASVRQATRMPPLAPDDLRFAGVTADRRYVGASAPAASFALRTHRNSERRSDPTLAGDLTERRYSTFQIPAGRYALSSVGPLSACLGTLTFEVAAGDVAYLGDWVVSGLPDLPQGFASPFGNTSAGFDADVRTRLRLAAGDDLEAARAALQADGDAKARLTRVAYQNGYRLPCEGRYIGRVANTDWTSFDSVQADSLNDDLAATIAGENSHNR